MKKREAMRKRRLEMKCSQAAIAKLMGVTPSCYAMIERGVRNPSADSLLALEAILGLPAAVLMGKESAKPAPTVQAHG